MRVLPNPKGIKHVRVGEGFCVRADLLRGIDGFIGDATIGEPDLTASVLYDALIEAKVLPSSETFSDCCELLRLRLRRRRLLLELRKTGAAWESKPRKSRKGGAA